MLLGFLIAAGWVLCGASGLYLAEITYFEYDSTPFAGVVKEYDYGFDMRAISFLG